MHFQSTPTTPFRRFRREAKETFALALPLTAGQVSQMLISVSDTVMIGRLGVIPLAAATFATTVLHLPLMFGIGMTMAVSVRVSQARGANDPAAAREALRNGLTLGLVVGLLTMLAVWGCQPFLGLFRQDPKVISAVPHYFLIVALSLVPAMGAMAVKNHADAMNKPWPPLWILLAGGALNVLLNWVFIYGKLGAPAMGLEGAGVATLVARIATLAGMIAWCTHAKAVREWVPEHWFRKPNWTALRSLVRVGLPMSLQLFAEISAFVMATMMIGSLGAKALASHQVAITCAATVFMVPLGISMALTVRMGEAWGAGENSRLRDIVASGWLIGLVFTAFSATAFVLFNRTIAGWFVTDPQAIAMAAGLLLIGAFFQVSDCVQIVSAGALRGLNDVKVPAWLAFAAYWLISLPVGWLLAFPLGLGVKGVWWGITLGLTLTAGALGARALWMTGRGAPVFERGDLPE
jgi:MATE family multidrug resistance protein